jgi:hypothetical protein
VTEKDIREFITFTENDLRLAKEFLAMWTRRNGTGFQTSPAMHQPPLIKDNAKTADTNEYGASKRAILAAIEKCPTDYTLYDIEKVMAEQGTPMERGAISQALNRLSKGRVIKQLRKGSGRNPAVYRKDLTASPAA